MYKLENNVAWTTELKEAFKHNVTRAKLIWSGTEINEQNYIRDLELDDERYISNYGFIGTATAKKVEVNLSDINGDINLENQEFTLKIGADYNGTTYYINYGNFIVDKPPENDETNGKKRVVAYDYMIKFNKPYTNRVTYPCTLKVLLQDVCSQAEVELGSTSFLNDDFVVQDNQFEGATLREVLQNIGKCAFSWARIGQDNKLYLDFSLIPETTETITIDEYKSDAFKKANEYYGPVNQVTYADSNMEGQESRVKDQSSIDLNGLKEIVIYDNVFAYTPTKRDQLIQAGSNILGLTYMPITQLELIGFAYLDCRDIIEVGTLDENTYTSRVFNHRITYNGTLHDGIVTEGTSNNEEAYKNTATDIYQNQQTRIIVDKANKQIQAVIEEVSEQNNKISQVTQTVDDLSSKISDIADITTYGESSYASVQLDGVNESEPIMLKVHPTTTNISYLYPRNNLYPSNDLYMPTRTIRFTRTYEEDGETLTQNIDYELPDNLLFYDSETYDEFYLDYESQTCQVTKRCQYNADGTVSALAPEVVNAYSYPEILLGEGNYTVSLLNYQYGYIFTRLMAKNIYTTQFYTKVETNSLINQTANNIDLSVNQKLTNYSTTNEMNSAINMKADSITSSVSNTYITKTASANNIASAKTEAINSANNSTDNKLTNYYTKTQTESKISQTASSITSSVSATYETKTNAQNTYATKSTLTQTADSINTEVSKKVGNNEVISKINQSSEAVTINANKISLAGKTINMTSDDIAINSTNFKVDKNGKVTVIDSGQEGNLKVKTSNNNYNTIVRPYGLSCKGPSGIVDIDADFVAPGGNIMVAPGTYEASNYTSIQNGSVSALSISQHSKESMKKNIERFKDNAIDIVKNSEIYKYNFKFEDDEDKKHIGFVIADEGGNYKTPDEVISAKRDGIEQYTMVSILWKAVQEQQVIIEQLKSEINELKGEK